MQSCYQQVQTSAEQKKARRISTITIKKALNDNKKVDSKLLATYVVTCARTPEASEVMSLAIERGSLDVVQALLEHGTPIAGTPKNNSPRKSNPTSPVGHVKTCWQ